MSLSSKNKVVSKKAIYNIFKKTYWLGAVLAVAVPPCCCPSSSCAWRCGDLDDGGRAHRRGKALLLWQFVN
jgi:hypothetical protein